MNSANIYDFNVDDKEELVRVLNGIIDGSLLSSRCITTRHLQDSSISPRKLISEYATEKEISDARTDTFGEKHKSLTDRIDKLERLVRDQRATISMLYVTIEHMKGK